MTIATNDMTIPSYNPNRPPTDKHLRALHEAYQAYMEHQPWRELTERNPFVLTHPVTGADALCVALGHWTIEYGLGIYLGQKGLEAYRREVLQLDLAAHWDCDQVAATTGQRNLVQYSERKRLGRLGITYEQEDGWPVWFRASPRRYIRDQEAVLLTQALQASVSIVLLARAGRLEIFTDERPHPGREPVTALRSQREPGGEWEHTQFVINP